MIIVVVTVLHLPNRGSVRVMLSLYGKVLQTIDSPFILKLLETWQSINHVIFATKLMVGGCSIYVLLTSVTLSW